jgi:phospholipase C
VSRPAVGEDGNGRGANAPRMLTGSRARRALWAASLCATALFAVGCAGQAQSGAALELPLSWPGKVAFHAHTGPRLSPIQHVVIIVQENRSFDDLFQGYPGADSHSSGLDSKGKTIPLRAIPLEAPFDLDHSSYDFETDYDGGKMDGFDREEIEGNSPPQAMYAYVPHRESKPYFDIAKQYVLGDRMFTSHIDMSFVSHQYIIAGQAGGAVNIPPGTWGCGGGSHDDVLTILPGRIYGGYEKPCFNYTTLGDELDAAGLPWRFYTVAKNDIWSAYQAVRHIHSGPDWNNVISPNTQFFSDIAAGNLGAVTWITPSCANSDHSGCEGKGGPAWVTSLVDAIGESPFWSTTTIFVMWDEWGGWYDHVPPPYVDYDGLGFRVPLLVVSPYAKARYVSHVQYEHGSILRYIEDQFGLPQLSASDARANSPEPDCLDMNQAPRPFVPFPNALKPRDFIRAPLDLRPPDTE